MHDREPVAGAGQNWPCRTPAVSGASGSSLLRKMNKEMFHPRPNRSEKTPQISKRPIQTIPLKSSWEANLRSTGYHRKCKSAAVFTPPRKNNKQNSQIVFLAIRGIMDSGFRLNRVKGRRGINYAKSTKQSTVVPTTKYSVSATTVFAHINGTHFAHEKGPTPCKMIIKNGPTPQNHNSVLKQQQVERVFIRYR